MGSVGLRPYGFRWTGGAVGPVGREAPWVPLDGRRLWVPFDWSPPLDGRRLWVPLDGRRLWVPFDWRPLRCAVRFVCLNRGFR